MLDFHTVTADGIEAAVRLTGSVGTLSCNGAVSVNGALTATGLVITGATPTVTGLTKSMVSLSNCDNTSDVSKPISTLQQAGLNRKSNIASPSFHIYSYNNSFSNQIYL